MGFRVAAPPPKTPPLLLVAYLPQPGPQKIAAIAKAMPDALLLGPIEANPKSLEKMSQAAGSVPWGVLWPEAPPPDLAPLLAAHCDFMAVKADMAPASFLAAESLGRVLLVDAGLSDGRLRAIDFLPIDAILLQLGQQPYLTVGHLLLCQHLALLIRKPLLAMLPSGVKAEEMRGLRDVGVKGVVAELGAEELSSLRQAIESLPPVKGERQGVILPRLGAETGPPPEEEEEE